MARKSGVWEFFQVLENDVLKAQFLLWRHATFALKLLSLNIVSCVTSPLRRGAKSKDPNFKIIHCLISIKTCILKFISINK